MFDLAKPTTVAGAVEIYDNVFNDCGAIIQIIERQGEDVWNRAQVADGQVSDLRTNDAAFVNFSALTNPTAIYEFGRTLFKYLDAYGKRYQVAFSGLEPACLNRYEVGQEYKPHADDGPGHPRVISALVYMNDVAKGGETHFTLFDEVVKPLEGRLVIFPSNYAYAHQALPPESGVKYSLAVWTTPLR